jgi:hypothetical protein
MARRPEDVQIQVVVSAELRKALGKAALVHQDDVDRERLMGRGPMLGYIAKWFLALPQAEQLKVIQEGKRLFDAGSVPPDRGEPVVQDGVALGAQGRKTNAKRKHKAADAD